jgi:hypothetical protein
VPVICPSAKAKYFKTKDWTVGSTLIGLRKSGFWRNALSVIPGRIEDANPESIPPDVQAVRWIPVSRWLPLS